MNYIKMNNDVRIPQIGLGVYQTPEGEQTVSSVRWALEAGYRHIDAAKVYGNEKSVGEGIRSGGIPRSEIFLTTKLWNEDIRAGRTKEAFQESLDALGTDYIDLYLIHWPADGYEKAWADMEELYRAGKIRAIGVSNFQKHHLEHLMETAAVTPAVNQIESHPYFNNQEMIDYCFQHRIVVEVWSPLGGTGGNVLQDATLNRLAGKYEKSPAQIVLRWDIQRNVVVIPKSTHKERIIANRDVFNFELSKEDMELISSLNRGQRVGPHPDTFDF